MPTVTLELPEDLFLSAQQTARQNQQPLSDFIIRNLPALLSTVKEQEPDTLTDEQRASAQDDLRRLAGLVYSGDPDSADNERIDADLAAAYAAD